MKREDVLESIRANVANQNLINHMLATEAIMRALARRFGQDEMARAILCHNEAHGVPCQTPLEKALYCADPLTGLIVAGALVRPDKKLKGLTTQSMMKRFGEKRFATGANREQIAKCSELGLTLEEFIALGLEAMKGIANEIGL